MTWHTFAYFNVAIYYTLKAISSHVATPFGLSVYDIDLHGPLGNKRDLHD